MPQENFWTSLATYCEELAPVAGPLLAAVGDTAEAVDRANRPRARRSSSQTLRANRPTRILRPSSQALRSELLATEDDYE